MISAISGLLAGAGLMTSLSASRIDRIKSSSDKYWSLYLLMNQWVRIRQDGKNLKSYFQANGYQTIAIYGMNYIGETLYRELRESGIFVKYAIDKNAEAICSEVDVILPEYIPGGVDVIVVTPITYFDEIEDELASKVSCPVISMEEILDESE